MYQYLAMVLNLNSIQRIYLLACSIGQHIYPSLTFNALCVITLVTSVTILSYF